MKLLTNRLNLFKKNLNNGFGKSFEAAYWFRIEYKILLENEEEMEFDPMFYGVRPVLGKERRKLMSAIEKYLQKEIKEATRDVESCYVTLAVAKQLDIFAEQNKNVNVLLYPNKAYIYPKTKNYQALSLKPPMSVCVRQEKSFMRDGIDSKLIQAIRKMVFTEDEFVL